jgi:hypothetical protein
MISKFISLKRAAFGPRGRGRWFALFALAGVGSRFWSRRVARAPIAGASSNHFLLPIVAFTIGPKYRDHRE